MVFFQICPRSRGKWQINVNHELFNYNYNMSLGVVFRMQCFHFFPTLLLYSLKTNTWECKAKTISYFTINRLHIPRIHVYFSRRNKFRAFLLTDVNPNLTHAFTTRMYFASGYNCVRVLTYYDYILFIVIGAGPWRSAANPIDTTSPLL